MDSGFVVQLFLGVLWALGCLLFVTFLLEFREDMFVHPNYPRTTRPPKSASKQRTGELRGGRIAAAEKPIAETNANDYERPLYAKAGSANGG